MTKFFLHNWISVLYVNFRYLPFKQAIKLPIDIARNVKFRCKGKIFIKARSIHRGMVSLGFHGSDLFPSLRTMINIDGTLIAKGSGVRIGTGSTVCVTQNGSIILHEGVCIGAKSLVVSESQVEICENTIFSWNCQIMDTDTHSLQNTETGEVYSRMAPVKIGKDSWIGNHVIINKGVVLPEGTIVASSSLCNKDYTSIIPAHSVIGGVPAKLLSENRIRLSDKL